MNAPIITNNLFLFRSGAIFGLLAALSHGLFVTLLELSGRSGVYLTRTFADIWIIILAFGFNAFFVRRKFGQLPFSFVNGLTTFFSLNLVYSVVASAILFLLIKSNPEWMENYKSALVNYMESGRQYFIENLGQSAYDEQMKSISDLTIEAVWLDDLIKRKLTPGIFLIPIFSLIFRKK